MKRALLIGFLLLLTVATVAAQTANVANTAKPTIEASYSEEVKISNAYITDGSTQYPVVRDPLTDWNTTYTFTPEDILRNGNYTFVVEASDRVGNTGTANFDFTIDVAFGIRLLEPSFGVSNSSSYTIKAETTEAAHCSWSLIKRGDTLSGTWFDGESTSTFKFTHTLSGATFDQQTVWLKCRNQELAEVKQDYFFQVDNTAPSVMLSEDPNPIRDPADRSTILTIQTDDPTVCWMSEDGAGENPVGDSDPDSESTYKKKRTVNLSYDIADTDRYEFVYDVRCRNKAGLETTESTTVVVELTSSFVIDVVEPEPFTRKSPVPLTLETPITTVCEWQDNSTWQGINSADGKTHTTTLGSLPDGDYSIPLRCTSPSSVETGSADFVVDRTSPTNATISTQSDVCDVSTISASFNANDENGIDYFNYSVSRDGTQIVNLTKTQSEQVSVDATQPGTYTWSMTAYDKAGNSATAQSATVTVYNESAAVCDTFRPNVQLEDTYNDVQGGNDVSVICRDDNSGCKSNYNYSVVGGDEQCPTSSGTTNPMDTSLFVPCGDKACFWVSDNNNNGRFLDYLSTCEDDGGDPGTTPASCGDGQIQSGESCDGSNLAGRTCGSMGFSGGSLDCTSSCQLNTSQCIPTQSPEPTCGNGALEAGETCDGNEMVFDSCTELGFTSGDMGCNQDTCQIDTTNCGGGPGPQQPSCGDGLISSTESCDGSNLAGKTCSQLEGFDGGSLDCSSCELDTSQCTTPAPTQPTPGTCGDGVLSSGESCEGSNTQGLTCGDFGFDGGNLGCSSCNIDTSACTGGAPPPGGAGGEGPGEGPGQGSGPTIDPRQEPGSGGSGGGANCGNGQVDAGEECDGSNLGGNTWCDEIGMTGGRLSCNDQCQYDTSACRQSEEDFTPGEQEGTNWMALILIILGLLLMMGGGGYLGYKKYYGPGIGKPKGGKRSSSGKTGQQQGPSRRSGPQRPGQSMGPQRSPTQRPRQEPTADQVREKEKQKILEKVRRAKKKEERKQLLDEFEVKDEKDADTKKVKKDADEALGGDEE